MPKLKIQKKEVEVALEKAKQLEKEDLYSIQKLQEEDTWFKQQAKKITLLFGKFPIGRGKSPRKR